MAYEPAIPVRIGPRGPIKWMQPRYYDGSPTHFYGTGAPATWQNDPYLNELWIEPSASSPSGYAVTWGDQNSPNSYPTVNPTVQTSVGFQGLPNAAVGILTWAMELGINTLLIPLHF